MTANPLSEANRTIGQTGLATSQAMQTRDANESAIRGLWNALRTQQLFREGGINFSKLVVNIERNSANVGTPCSELFRRLITQITTQYPLTIQPLGATTPSLQNFTGDIQRQLFDNSLTKIWEKIKQTDQNLPDFASVAEIRAFLNNNANTAQLNAITELDLRDLSLHVVPPEICKLTQLQRLNLCNNQLTAIPDLSMLANLLSLDLSNNQLTEVPALSALTMLEMLVLNDNQLAAIPDLSALTRLTWLILYNNQLTAVPGLDALHQLERLQLADNHLTEIPGLNALTRLKWCYLSNNRLTRIPDLSALTQLRTLYIENNQLREVPDLRELAHLAFLNLNDNQLTAVPGLNASNLQMLYLKNNRLTAISDLSTLTGLVWLKLSNNQLRAIPDLSALRRLTWLYLNNNQLTEVPGLNALTQLVRLDLSNNHLMAIPDLSTLTALYRPDLSNNPCTQPLDSGAPTLSLEINPESASSGVAPESTTLAPSQEYNSGSDLSTITAASPSNGLSGAVSNSNALPQLEVEITSNNSSITIPDPRASTPVRETNPTIPLSTDSSSPVRPQSFTQRFVRGIDLLFTKLRRHLTECFQFLKGLIFRT